MQNMLFNWYVDVDSWNKTRYAFFIRPVGNTISTSQYTVVAPLHLLVMGPMEKLLSQGHVCTNARGFLLQ